MCVREYRKKVRSLDDCLVAFIMYKCYNGEKKMNENKSCVINKFRCYGKIMVVVRLKNATHVMSLSEWKWIKRCYQERVNYRKRRCEIA